MRRLGVLASLSGLTDNAFRDLCNKMCGDPCTATHVRDEIVATTPCSAARQISDKIVIYTSLLKLIIELNSDNSDKNIN